MSGRHFSAPKFSYVLGPVIIIALGSMTIASAQSPFASKKKQQAWETQPTTRSFPPSVPSRQPITQPSQPYYPAQPSAQSGILGNAQPKVYGDLNPPTTASVVKTSPAAPVQTQSSGSYNYQAPQQARRIQNYQGQSSQSLPTQPYPVQSYSAPSRVAQTRQAYPPQGQYNQPRTWKQKLGLNNLSTVFKGFIKGGVAAVKRDDGANSDWSEEFVGDAKAEFEVSAITSSGYEYGLNLEGRAQYDKFRRGFGGRLRNCPPAQAGCSTALIAGVPTSLRGHTSRFYTSGADDAKDTQFALESAHLFLRTSFGDVTLGRDDGTAYLFSLGAPTLLAVGASNSPVDYTGLDSVKTVNDASGFSEKVTYTSPRLLGDSVGVGVQFGASYAPNARACGVDYCVKRNDVVGTQSPDLDDIFEFGFALDRTFANGFKMEATASYATGSEQSSLAAFDDLKAFNAGAELSWLDITLGGSFLKSNNGLANGDYEAWDIGATWKPSALGFTLGYGHATDDNVNLSSDQFVAGVTYEFNKFTLGAGAQYIERDVQAFNGAAVLPQKDKATALFVEGGFKF